jgi:hypothetical protein
MENRGYERNWLNIQNFFVRLTKLHNDKIS